MSRQENSILTNEHALNREPVPLRISSENKGKQSKGKKNDQKTKEKKCTMFESMASPEFLLAPSESPLSEAYIHDHCATQPRNIVALNLLYLNHFSLP